MKLLIHAREELAEGNRLQAGEKAWGAVVQPMKAIAEQRGWPHESHRDVREVVSQVALEYGFDHERSAYPALLHTAIGVTLIAQLNTEHSA